MTNSYFNVWILSICLRFAQVLCILQQTALLCPEDTLSSLLYTTSDFFILCDPSMIPDYEISA